jgi:hypothetical protein
VFEQVLSGGAFTLLLPVVAAVLVIGIAAILTRQRRTARQHDGR